MKFAFHYRAPFLKQLALLDAMIEGARVCGDVVEGVEGFDSVRDVDGLVMFGIGGNSRIVFDAYQEAGKRVVFWDKGYQRGGGWYRVAVDSFQPREECLWWTWPSDRFDWLELEPRPYKIRGDFILFDGASNKFCQWQRLGNWIEWGAATVARIRQFTDRPIIYRPRPSHNAPVAVPGAELSDGNVVPLRDDLARARVVVSYGGNIGWDCVLAGVPHFAIGDSIARALSRVKWDKLDEPHIPSNADRRAWCNAVAYQQWTLDEISNGTAWKIIREQLGMFRPRPR